MFDLQDFGTRLEMKSIVENPDIFEDLYSKFPLTGISNLEDYYFYLLSLKLIGTHKMIPILSKKEHIDLAIKLSSCAEKTIQTIDKGDLIRFINGNIKAIYNKDVFKPDVRIATLNIIADYSNGISKDVFEFLSKDYGFLLIDRFDKFEKVFEKYPDLFCDLYPTCCFNEISTNQIEKNLGIWRHILNKGKSSLKEAVNNLIDSLTENIRELSTTATIDNILLVEGPIRVFHLFLQQIKSPLANEFSIYAKSASDLLSKNIHERGQFFQYEIPVKDTVNKWKETETWEIRLLSLTHDLVREGDSRSCVSRLEKEPEKKHPFFDSVRTNIPTDEYFTISHQQLLDIIANVDSKTIAYIIGNKETLVDYLSLINSAIYMINEYLNDADEQLVQDIEMLLALIQVVSTNLQMDRDVLHGICYGTSMYACSLSEKLLRILYLHLSKDETYVPINRATFGELLVPSNAYIVKVFGEHHVRNLSFFLQQISPSNVGQNIRNSLAHWSSITTAQMTPLFVAKMLWLFTDILNTVFWYCLQNVIERDNFHDQL